MSPASETPATRQLAQVLRQAFVPEGDPVQLYVGRVTQTLTGSEGNAYLWVDVAGTEIKVPLLRGSTAPAVGDPAYLLATRDFLLCIGTVRFN